MIANVVQHGKAQDHVVIVGGGDLVIATQILKNYPEVKKVTVCEIDERVVEVTKRYFSFADIVDQEKASGRLEIVIESGAVYMDKLLQESKQGKIGAFIIDCTDFDPDENSIASELFTPEFYRKIYELLEPCGGFSQQITDMSCLDPFSQRARAGGFQKHPHIFAAKTPEYGGELPIAYCFKPP
jgi:spermidine synthase